MKRLLLVLAACGSDGPRTPTAEEMEVAVARQVVTDSLVDVRAAIDKIRARAAKPDATWDAMRVAEHDNNKAFFTCSMIKGMEPFLATVADPLMFDIQRVCWHDAPLAMLAAAVAVVEADTAHELCWPVAGHMSTAAMMLRVADPEVDALRARFRAACPKQPDR